MNKCEQCGKEVKGYGKKCVACRVRASREKSVTDVTEIPVTAPVTSKPVTAPEMPKIDPDNPPINYPGEPVVKYWENQEYLEKLETDELLDILNVCYEEGNWMASPAFKEIKKRKELKKYEKDKETN